MTPNWKALFEQAAAAVPDRAERGLAHRFGPPATDASLAALARHLGGPVPPALQSLLKAFDGVEVRDRFWGPGWWPLYLSVDGMLRDVPDYLRESGNPLPGRLERVAFFAHQNGFAQLYGVCLQAFAGFESGQVLGLDHETGAFRRAEPSLRAFVASARYAEL